MRSIPFPTVILLPALMLSGCTVIGPTVAVAPGAGKSEAAFEQDHRACMAQTDAALQPVADRLNGQASSPQQFAANNDTIQREYDRSYASCMDARGNILPGELASAQTPEATAPAPTGGTGSRTASDSRREAGYHLLRLSYHRAGSPTPDANDVLWRDAIAHPLAGPGSAVPIYSIEFDDGPRTLLISIAGQGPDVCDDGPNTATSTRDYGICPGRLAILVGDRITAVRDLGPLCFEAVDAGIPPGGPGWKNPARWGTRGLFNQPGKVVQLITLRDGRIQPGCSRTLRVR